MFKEITNTDQLTVSKTVSFPVYLSGTAAYISLADVGSEFIEYIDDKGAQIKVSSPKLEKFCTNLGIPGVSDVCIYVDKNTQTYYPQATANWRVNTFVYGAGDASYSTVVRAIDERWVINPAFSHSIAGYPYSPTATVYTLGIPNIIIGEEIKSGSFIYKDWYKNGGIDYDQRTAYDDGYGRLYFSCSTTDPTINILNGQQLGFIFYDRGIVVNTASWFGTFQSSGEVWYSGSYTRYVKIMNVNIPANELTVTSNKTYARNDSDDIPQCVVNNEFVYFNGINLYDEDYELIGEARLANPVLKNNDKDIIVRLRLEI